MNFGGQTRLTLGQKVLINDVCNTVRRSWKERLFTRPWRPLQGFKQVPVMKRGEIYRLPNGDLICCSATRNDILNHLESP